MKTIQERRLEILKWEKENRNATNRSIRNTSCAYSGEIGCAVGRLIEDKDLCARLDGLEYSGVFLTPVFNQLPENIKELGKEFLDDLQKLHDRSCNWTVYGLSDWGNTFMAELESKWGQATI